MSRGAPIFVFSAWLACACGGATHVDERGTPGPSPSAAASTKPGATTEPPSTMPVEPTPSTEPTTMPPGTMDPPAVDPPPQPPTYSQFVNISGLAWGASRYVAVGRELAADRQVPGYSYDDYHGAVYTSTDGISWKAVDQVFPDWLSDVAYGNDLFVAVSTSPTGATAYASKDGLTWTATAISDPPRFALPSFVAFGNGVFITSTPAGPLQRSKDGKDWTHLEIWTGSLEGMRGVEFGAGVFASWQSGNEGAVAISANGDAWTSVDATGTSLHWVERLFGAPTGFVGLTEFQCCFGENGGPWYGSVQSPDGSTWTFDEGTGAVPVIAESAACIELGIRSVSAGKTCATAKPVLEDRRWFPSAVLHEGSVYLVAGDVGIVTSTDGVTFTRTLWNERIEN